MSLLLRYVVKLLCSVRLSRFAREGYRPERHYMRWPGPQWHAKHGALAGASHALASRLPKTR